MAERIPLRVLPSDTVQITLEQVPYLLRTRYSTREARWRVDLKTIESDILFSGQKILHAVNISGRFADERLPQEGDIWAIDVQGPVNIDDYSLEDIEDRLQLWYLTSEESDAIFS